MFYYIITRKYFQLSVQNSCLEKWRRQWRRYSPTDQCKALRNNDWHILMSWKYYICYWHYSIVIASWKLRLVGRSIGEGNGYPHQYSCLENSMDRGAWRATSVESQRVGHYWPTNTFTFRYRYKYRHSCEYRLDLLLFSRSVVPDSLWPHGLQHARFLSFTNSRRQIRYRYSWWQWRRREKKLA